MGVEIKFTDRDLPVSPAFIEFLHHHIEGHRTNHAWHDQLSETLVPAEFEHRVQYAESVADQVLHKHLYRSLGFDPAGPKAVLERADAALRRVADSWRMVGLDFPPDALRECC